MTPYALRVWLQQSAVDVFSGGGVVVTVSNPKLPYRLASEVVSDDRETQGGNIYSRIRSVRRRGNLEFPLCAAAERDVWTAWYVATLGGRIQFMIETPDTFEWVAVKAKNVEPLIASEYQLFQPPTLEVVEWL